MVLFTENPSFLLASCWSVEVVKGGAGLRRVGRTSIFETLNFAPIHFCQKGFCTGSIIKATRTFSLERDDLALCVLAKNRATILKYGVLLNCWISRSRSTISFTATD
jgi:hypothetical protein